jgi:hypothetical protein
MRSLIFLAAAFLGAPTHAAADIFVPCGGCTAPGLLAQGGWELGGRAAPLYWPDDSVDFRPTSRCMCMRCDGR